MRRFSGVLVTCVFLSGCGTVHYNYRETLDTTRSEWNRADTPPQFLLEKPTGTPTNITFPVIKRTVEEERLVDIFWQEQQKVKDPNLLMILIAPITLFTICLDDECFGKTYTWRNSGDKVQRNHRLSGKTRLVDKPSDKDVHIDVSIAPQKKDGTPIGAELNSSYQAGANGLFSLNLLPHLELIEQRPEQLKVVANVRGNATADARAALLNEDSLQGLQVDRWMDQTILIDLLMAHITQSLRDNKFAEALPYFDRMLRTGTELPESFYYHHAETLWRAGKASTASEKLDQYFAKFGTTGESYHKAIALAAKVK